jgi:hypothetical protein
MLVLHLSLALLPPTHIFPSFSCSYSSSFLAISLFLFHCSLLPFPLCLLLLPSILLLPLPFLLFFFSSFLSTFHLIFLRIILLFSSFSTSFSSLPPGPLQFRIYFWHGINRKFGTTPWMGNRPIERHLAERNSNTSAETTCTYPTLRLGFELTVWFERALDHVATLIGESGNWLADVGCNQQTCRPVVSGQQFRSLGRVTGSTDRLVLFARTNSCAFETVRNEARMSFQVKIWRETSRSVYIL